MVFFEQNGYVYDNEYEPDDESIAYFLFTSKRGNCTNYATSMTLMARMLGLPARYVEGFAAYENYAPETIAYIEALGQINIWLAEQADTVYEVMAGQAVCWKAEDRK